VGSVRETRHAGKASHGGHRGHRGGIGIGGESASVDARACGARTTRMGKASHRGALGTPWAAPEF
jgi:hypothetical protein